MGFAYMSRDRTSNVPETFAWSDLIDLGNGGR